MGADPPGVKAGRGRRARWARSAVPVLAAAGRARTEVSARVSHFYWEEELLCAMVNRFWPVLVLLTNRRGLVTVSGDPDTSALHGRPFGAAFVGKQARSAR